MSFLTVALAQKKVLLIGAGAVAKQKAQAMRKAKFDFAMQSKEIIDDFFILEEVKVAPIAIEDVFNYEIIIDATGSDEVLQILLEAKKKKNFLLNVVDNPPYCDFYFTAMACYGDLQVGVSSSGSSPTLAQIVRDKIEKILPTSLDSLALKMKKLREKTKERGILKLRASKGVGKVFIVGCSCGDIKSLTIEVFEILQTLDVALVDALAGKEILQYLPKECKIIDVSKQKGHHSKPQEEINKLLAKYAKQGLVVGRLKGGDPYLFGRLKEECDYLDTKKIEYEVFNGISALFKAFNVSGVIPTIRDISKGITVVSAHLKESFYNDSWVELLRDKHHTVVVFMAYTFAKKIQESALKNNIDTTTPVMFVSNIDQKNEKVVVGTIATLDKIAKEVEKPAILIMGEVVKTQHRIKG